jgi:serine protease Do
MKRHLFILACLLPIISFSQSLTPERVAKIKSATVRITIESKNNMGTGFFINSDGDVLTCWHVIKPSLKFDTDGKLIGFHKIFIELNNGTKYEVKLAPNFYDNPKIWVNAIAYDYCYLYLVKNIKKKFEFLNLKVNEYESSFEGQEVYTCGYPIGITQQFISKGIISTKYIDSNNVVDSLGVLVKKPRNQALLDLTMNRGNSGGAIIKLGKTINDDEVIGIANFIINPVGGKADSLINQYNNSQGVKVNDIDITQTFGEIIDYLSSTSIGVSGCVSIDHYLLSMGYKK